MDEANQSRTVVSVPRPPATSNAIYSPLQRGGESRALARRGGGAIDDYLFRCAGCWRTGHGDHRPTCRVHPFRISINAV